jgi:hypothetical protein
MYYNAALNGLIVKSYIRVCVLQKCSLILVGDEHLKKLNLTETSKTMNIKYY